VRKNATDADVRNGLQRGAIGMVGGKAKLQRDDCDGPGNCLPVCQKCLAAAVLKRL